MNDERVVLRDLLQEIDVAGDERGLGDDADAQALLAGEDFEERAGDADAAFDRLIRIGGSPDRNLFGWVNVAELLFEQPRGVFLEVDLVLEGAGPGLLRDVDGAWRRGIDRGRLEELVGVAGDSSTCSRTRSRGRG